MKYALAAIAAGLVFIRLSGETLPHALIYRPALCLVAQGAKRLTVGDAVFDYREGQALIVSVEPPGVGYVTEASRDAPFLGLVLDFDIPILREVPEEMEAPPEPEGDTGAGVFIDALSSPVADCVARLVRTLDTPDATAILYPRSCAS